MSPLSSVCTYLVRMYIRESGREEKESLSGLRIRPHCTHVHMAGRQAHCSEHGNAYFWDVMEDLNVGFSFERSV